MKKKLLTVGNQSEKCGDEKKEWGEAERWEWTGEGSPRSARTPWTSQANRKSTMRKPTGNGSQVPNGWNKPYKNAAWFPPNNACGEWRIWGLSSSLALPISREYGTKVSVPPPLHHFLTCEKRGELLGILVLSHLHEDICGFHFWKASGYSWLLLAMCYS